MNTVNTETKMKNRKVAIVVFCFILVACATTAFAALTLNSTSITSDGILTLNSASQLILNAFTITPPSDSLTAFNFTKADGTTSVLNIDTTNSAIGIGTDAPLATLTVQADKTSHTSTQANVQLSLQGKTVTTKELALGYDTSANYGLIQARDFGNTYSSLSLNPSGGNVGIGTTIPNAALDINSNSFILETAQTPATASAPCTIGMIAWDINFMYVCTGTDTWKRSALSTW